MADELTTIATFTNSMLAHLAKDVLAMRSIDCFLQDENAASLGYLAVGSLVGIRLQVRKSEAERATHILEQELGDQPLPKPEAPETRGHMEENKYEAAGAVVVHRDQVLVLQRPSRNEIRLPKGHIDEGEDPLAGAMREVEEESGYINLKSIADLGTRTLEFSRSNVHVIRQEHFFLLTPQGNEPENKGECEEQFEPEWVSWGDAERMLTYENERAWLRTAKMAFSALE